MSVSPWVEEQKLRAMTAEQRLTAAVAGRCSLTLSNLGLNRLGLSA